jgi:hypothetical protein
LTSRIRLAIAAALGLTLASAAVPWQGPTVDGLGSRVVSGLSGLPVRMQGMRVQFGEARIASLKAGPRIGPYGEALHGRSCGLWTLLIGGRAWWRWRRIELSPRILNFHATGKPVRFDRAEFLIRPIWRGWRVFFRLENGWLSVRGGADFSAGRLIKADGAAAFSAGNVQNLPEFLRKHLPTRAGRIRLIVSYVLGKVRVRGPKGPILEAAWTSEERFGNPLNR